MLWIKAKNSVIALLFLLSFQILNAQILITGASQPEAYLPQLSGKRVALVANQTSVVQNEMHLVDFLLQQKVNLVKVFSPEHGFRGQLPDGEEVKDGKDAKSGLPVTSLYGNTKKPTKEMLQGVDIVIFDIQDVGCRFYTYISTLTLVMEACAENSITVLVFDRPNPNGFYIDGPVLQPGFESFVGMHKIPVVYGMTIGEYAKMVNGEKWLANGVTCNLQVIELKNYFRDAVYNIPVAPSPNLPNMASVLLYPSLCMFEGTNISVGRGTDLPFQQFGAPFLQSEFNEFFIPQPNAGSTNPPLKGQKCYGVEVVNFGLNFIPEHRKLYIYWLLESYRLAPEADKEKFFTSYFDKLAGTDLLQQQIKQGLEEEEIRQSWQKDIDAFKIIRAKYLLYPDF
jgi:uncharacterized protein YbbC (DUF1343 family)